MPAKKKPDLIQLGGAKAGLVGKSTITALGLSADHRFAVTGDVEGVIRVFNLSTEEELGATRISRKIRKRDRGLTAVGVTHSGTRVTAINRDGDLFCGKLGDDELDWTRTHEFRGSSVLPCADDARVALISSHLVLFEDGEQVWEDADGHRAEDFAMAPDGRIAVAHYADKVCSIRLFAPNGHYKLLASIDVPKSFWLARIGFLGNDRIVVVAQNGELVFWNGKKNGSLEFRQSAFGREHRRPTMLAPLGCFVSGELVFSFDDAPPRKTVDRVWACAIDGSVVLGENGARIERIGPDLLLPTSKAALNGWVRAIAFEPDLRFVWTADDTAAHRWALPNGTLDRSFPLPEDHVAHGISHDGRVLLLKTHAADCEYQQLFDLQRGALLHSRVETHSLVSGLSPDGRFFAFGSSEKGAAVLEVATGKIVRTLVANDPHVPYNAVPSAGGRFVVTSNNRYQFVTFGPEGKQLAAWRQRPPGVATSMCVGNSGKRFVFGRDNAHHVEAWTLEGRPLAPNFTGLRRNDISTLALSEDEKWVAASDGVAIAVWRFGDRKRVLALQEGAWSLAFSADSKQLAVGGNGAAFIVPKF